MYNMRLWCTRMLRIVGRAVMVFLAAAVVARIIPYLDAHWWQVVKKWWWTNGVVVPWLVRHYGITLCGVAIICVGALSIYYCVSRRVWLRCGWVRKRFAWIKEMLNTTKAETMTSESKYEKDWASSLHCSDELGRGAFVSFLAKLLECTDQDDTVYIGLYGTWGSGKSWVLDSLKRKIVEEKRMVDFVCFSPWSGAKDLDVSIALLNAIVNQVHFEKEDIASFIRAYGKSLGVEPRRGILDGVPVIGKWLECLYAKAFDVSALKNKVVESLKGYGRRILIAIEDVDRLDYAEVREVIRAVKANVDIPNVIYMILGDEDYVAEAIGNKMSGPAAGRRYLQKIIDFPCPLPNVSQADLHRLYYNRVASFLKKNYDVDFSKEDESKLAMISGLFLTMRDVKRAFNEFKAEVDLQEAKSDGDDFSIDFIDLAGLSAIKALELSLYAKLQDIYWTIYNVKDIVAASKTYNEEWMGKDVLGIVDRRRRGAVSLFLEWFMGMELKRVTGISGVDGKYYCIEGAAGQGLPLANHSLMSAYCIDNYFTSKHCDTCLRNADQNEFLAKAITDSNNALKVAKRIADGGKLAYLGEVLRVYDPPTNESGLCNYIVSLMLIADEKWPEEQLYPTNKVRSYSSGDLYSQLFRSVREALGNKALQRTEFLSALKDSGCFTVGLMECNTYWDPNDVYEFISLGRNIEKAEENVINVVLENAIHAIKDGRFEPHPHSKELSDTFCRLVCICEDEMILTNFRQVYDKVVKVSMAAPFWIMEGCKRIAGGTALGQRFAVVDYDKFMRVVGDGLERTVVDQLDALGKQKEYGLAADDKKIFACLKYARKQKMAGRPYGDAEQVAAIYGIAVA